MPEPNVTQHIETHTDLHAQTPTQQNSSQRKDDDRLKSERERVNL